MTQVFLVYTIADVPTELAKVTPWGESMPLGLIPADSPVRSRMFWATAGSLSDELFEAIPEPSADLEGSDEAMSLCDIVGTALSHSHKFEQQIGPEAAEELGLGFHSGDPEAVEAFLIERGATLVPASDLLSDILFIRGTTDEDGTLRPVDTLSCSTSAGERELESIHHTGLYAIDRKDPANASFELIHYDERKRLDLSSIDETLLELRFA